MISNNPSKNVFEAHWDWFAALAGIAALAAVAVWKFVLAGDPAADSSSPGRGETQKVAPVAMRRFEDLSARLAKPPKVAEIPDAKGSFLASGIRVFCTQGDPDDTRKTCGLPIPFPVEKCPICGARQKPLEKPEFDRDTDGDGLKDDWEKKYGLNPNDASDADADKDGDGFTNMEEFKAGTDPSDRDSHPDYLDYLKVKPELKQTYTAIEFTGATRLPRGVSFKFKDPAHAKDFNFGIVSAYENEEIGKTGFIVKAYEQKFIEKQMGGGMRRKIDVSMAVVQRKSDGKLIRLAFNARKTPVDVQATLFYDRPGGKTYEVTPGQTISLNGSEYKILDVRREGKSAAVDVVDSKTGKRRTIKALE